jgi:hypothetical protein
MKKSHFRCIIVFVAWIVSVGSALAQYAPAANVTIGWSWNIQAPWPFGANDLVLSGVTGSTQCLQANSSGAVSGTGSNCAAATTVSSSDGSLTISPTSGAVVASLNVGNANTWTGVQTFSANKLALAGVTGSTQCLQANSSGVVTGTGGACGSGSGAVNSVSNSDGTLTITPTTGVVVASLALGNANTWVGVQTFTNGDLRLEGSTSGSMTLEAPAIASSYVQTFQAATDTVADLGQAQTFTALNVFSTTISGSATTAGLTISPTWNTTGVIDAALLVNPTNTASATGSLLVDFQLAGSSKFAVSKAGEIENASYIYLGGATASQANTFSTSGLTLGSSSPFFWRSGGNSTSEATTLSEEAAGIVQVGTTTSNANGSLWAALLRTATTYSAAGTALPACNTASQGTHAQVSDATSPTYLGTYTSGGSVIAPVFCNGTNWLTD